MPRVSLVAFCVWNENAPAQWECFNPYFRELACVRGAVNAELNTWSIETAFDRDDDLVFDMQELVQG